MLKIFKYPKKYIGYGVWTFDQNRGPIKRKIRQVSGSFFQTKDNGVLVTLFRPAFVYLEGELESSPVSLVYMTKAECLQAAMDNALKKSEEYLACSCTYAEQSALWKNVAERIQKRRSKKGRRK